jgi:hypothetical protein
MKLYSALFLSLSVLFAGCKTPKDPEFANAPPEVAAYLKTPEGQKIIAAAKKRQAAITQQKLTLLNKTDHLSLLKECRLVIANRRALEYGNYGSHQSLISGSNSNLPPMIRSLSAGHIDATDKKVEVELGGGFHHYGIVAFNDGGPYEPSEEVNSKKLVDGLWFYEEKR